MDEHRKVSEEETRVKARHETGKKLNRKWSRRRRIRAQRRTRSASAVNSPSTDTDANSFDIEHYVSCKYTLLHRETRPSSY